MAFFLFLWKNVTYLRFHWFRTCLIFAGCLIMLFVVMKTTSRESIQPRFVPEPINEESFNTHLSCEPEDFISYAPSNPWIDDIMESVRQELGIVYTRWQPFSTKQDMMLFLDEHKNSKSFFIFFDEFPDNTTSLNTGNLSYFISATHGKTYNDRIYYNDDDVVGMQIFDDYISGGYFALQNAIDRKYIEKRTEKQPYPIEVGRLPQIELMDIDSTRVNFFGILFILFFYTIILTTFIVPLVEEKQDGMQAYLSFATSRSYLNCLTFYIIRFIIYLIFTCLSILIVYNYNGMGSAGFLPFATLMILFVLSTMNYALLVSVFLKSVYLAKVGGFLAICVPTLLFSIKDTVYYKFGYLISGNMFLEGLAVFQIFTNKRRNVTLDDISVRITEDSYTLLELCGILILQFFVYIGLYLYLSNIFPGFGGVRKPFYYIFTMFYKTRKPKDSSEVSLNADVPLKIVNLVKSFASIGKCQKPKNAVNNLNMEVEKNKITVLLGHNGAGKTTTINMIVGAIEKTSGSICVFGETDIEMYRNSIGYCPQHNIFMQYLTCKQHLEFFSRLRGRTRAEAKAEALTLLNELMLTEKADVVGEQLSGGMKRRLALAMAISGQTPIAVLDEPTSGLDPESRRILWDILLKLRKSRTILITTHYMEEAEFLGDVIAIMSQGELVCKGSSMELKRDRGSGYILKLLLDSGSNDENMKKIMNMIQGHVPEAKEHSTVKPTYCVTLPYSDRKRYSKLMEELDQRKDSLGISYFSVANSSLEDVFVNCAGTDEVDKCSPKKRGAYDTLSSGKSCGKYQFFGVWYKKLIYIKSKWLYTLIMFSFPLLTIAVTFWIMNVGASSYAMDVPIKLNIPIPNSEVYVKIAPEFSDFEHYLHEEIQSMNASAVYVPQHESLEETLLNIQEKAITHFYDRIFGAVELKAIEKGSPSVKILYSGNIIHSSVSLLNLVDNVMLKINAKHNLTIRTHNAQIPKSIVVSPARLEYFSSIVPIGCFFYVLFYVSLPFREIRTQFNKLQNISRFTYWSSHSLFDIILHFILVLNVWILIYLCNTKAIYTLDETVKIAKAIFLYGIAYLPLLYILAISFRSISTLSTYLFFFLMIATILPIITSANPKAIETYTYLINIFMLLPDFALKHQLIVINENHFIRRRNELKAKNNGTLDELLNENLFYGCMIFLCLEIFLIYVWDNLKYRDVLVHISIRNIFNQSSPVDPLEPVGLETVDSTDSGEHKDPSLRVDNLYKTYDSGKVHAVRGISFNVQDGECFGLLGLNGAGKSSTFEMITGNETINRGSVSIEGTYVSTDRFNLMYGYCPQVDALNAFMTSYEIMRYIAFLRGFSKTESKVEVKYWLKALDLYKYRDIPIKYYSGGTKRKLNTAMAMIGDPSVVFLDEPTTGVDPISRRFMWECIQELQRNGKTIVLTSHSMDECENLCNRLAIMVEGKIKCVDYIPKLKEKYGDKFTITIKHRPECSREDINKLKKKMDQHFECTEREHYDLTIVYLVKVLPWSQVFSKMETILNENGNILNDYAVNETTLEDIFLNMKNC